MTGKDRKIKRMDKIIYGLLKRLVARDARFKIFCRGLGWFYKKNGRLIMKRSIGILVIAILQTIEWLAITLVYTFAVLGHSARKSIPAIWVYSMYYIPFHNSIRLYLFWFLADKIKARIAMMIIFGFLTPFMAAFCAERYPSNRTRNFGAWFYWYLTRKKVKSQFN